MLDKDLSNKDRHEVVIYLALSRLFFMPKFKHKEVSEMFSDEILEKLFARPELQKLSAAEQSTLIDVFEEVLEEMEAEKNATLPEP